jgi:hypothetical protein
MALEDGTSTVMAEGFTTEVVTMELGSRSLALMVAMETMGCCTRMLGLMASGML